jgi:hypothetical protein
MKGMAKKLIDDFVAEESKGNPALMSVIRAKLALKGVNPESFTIDTEETVEDLRRIQEALNAMKLTTD